MYLNHCAVLLKLAQHCKQFKQLFKIILSAQMGRLGLDKADKRPFLKPPVNCSFLTLTVRQSWLRPGVTGRKQGLIRSRTTTLLSPGHRAGLLSAVMRVHPALGKGRPVISSQVPTASFLR